MRFIALLALVAAPGLTQHVGVINPSRGMAAPVGALPYGNILFPGGIPSTGASHASRLGATIRGGSYTGVAPGMRPVGPPRTVVVPYAYPVFYGGGYGYNQDPQPANVTVVMPQQQVPQVIIHNTYSPESTKASVREYSAGETPESGSAVRVYEGPKPRAGSASVGALPSIMDEKPTIYLIALKDGSVRQALGYWVQHDTLHYVTPNSTVNHVSVQMVDHQRSTELNAERKLDFELKLTR